MKSKTIILSTNNEKGRGILTIHEEDSLLHCKLRLYNIDNINRYCKLGVYHNKEVFSGNLLEKDGCYTSSMVGNFNIDNDFYTAIIDTSQNNKVLLSGGTYSGYFINDDKVFKTQEKHLFDNVEKEDPNTNIFDYNSYQSPINLQKNATIFDETLEDETSTMIKQNNSIKPQENEEETPKNCDKCANCKYKEYFYSHQEKISIETTNKNPQKEEEKEQPVNHPKPTILNSIIPQFNYVFENYPMDETLNMLIPNSKFVKINENKEQYSIGAIYKDNEMKYICYAVFKTYNSPAPEEIGKHYQWLPIDNLDPLSDGYYVVFQDTTDLKIVEL